MLLLCPTAFIQNADVHAGIRLCLKSQCEFVPNGTLFPTQCTTTVTTEGLANQSSG